MNILKFLVEQGVTVGFAEGRRLIRSGVVKVNNQIIDETFEVLPNVIVKVGNRYELRS